MLGDVTHTLQAIADADPTMARKIDDFLQACTEMMQVATQRITNIEESAQVSGGQLSMESQVRKEMYRNVGAAAQEAYGAACIHIVGAAAGLYHNIKNEQNAKLAILKARG